MGKKKVSFRLLVLIALFSGLFMWFLKDRNFTGELLNGFTNIPFAHDPEPNWYPNEHFNTSEQPETVGESTLLVELDSGRILYEKNSSEMREIASLVKIMTTVIALEKSNPEDETTISEFAASTGENSMGLEADEVYTLDELLHGLMLNSGNDSAVAIAEYVSGSVVEFVDLMNKYAKRLGMRDTVFYDSCGLDDRTKSTAVDLVKLSRYALKHPRFREIARTVEIELPYSGKHHYVYLYNQTNLLTTYPGVAGIKTGFTEDAGLCLMTCAVNEGKEVVGVVLDSIDRKGDMILMLDHGFESLGVAVEHGL